MAIFAAECSAPGFIRADNLNVLSSPCVVDPFYTIPGNCQVSEWVVLSIFLFYFLFFSGADE